MQQIVPFAQELRHESVQDDPALTLTKYRHHQVRGWRLRIRWLVYLAQRI
jgi:hypothetical protein